MSIYDFLFNFISDYIFVGFDEEILSYITMFFVFMLFVSILFGILRLFRIGGNGND